MINIKNLENPNVMGIYLIRNKINNKNYVGQSTNIRRRTNEHFRRTEQMIDNKIQEYGTEAFDVFLLEECLECDLDQKEQEYIIKYNSLIPNGYNMTITQGSQRGEDNIAAILTNEEVLFIRECYYNKTYKFSSDLWKEHFSHLSQGAIENIFFWRTWNHIKPEYNTVELQEHYKKNQINTGYRSKGESNHSAILSEMEVIQIRSLYEILTFKEIIDIINYNERLIKSIVYGENWKHLPIYAKRQKIWYYPEDWSEKEKNVFNKIKEKIINEQLYK